MELEKEEPILLNTFTLKKHDALPTKENKLVSAPAFASPHWNVHLFLEMDDSEKRIGGVWIQEQLDAKKKPVSYFFRMLNAAKQN